MNNRPLDKWRVRRLIREADTRILQDGHCLFSKRAKVAFRRAVRNYIMQLYSESLRLAKGLDGVSRNHVMQASRNLKSDTNERKKYYGPIGGALVGASLSTILAMILEHRYSGVLILICILFSIIGTTMVLLRYTRSS